MRVKLWKEHIWCINQQLKTCSIKKLILRGDSPSWYKHHWAWLTSTSSRIGWAENPLPPRLSTWTLVTGSCWWKARPKTRVMDYVTATQLKLARFLCQNQVLRIEALGIFSCLLFDVVPSLPPTCFFPEKKRCTPNQSMESCSRKCQYWSKTMSTKLPPGRKDSYSWWWSVTYVITI